MSAFEKMEAAARQRIIASEAYAQAGQAVEIAEARLKETLEAEQTANSNYRNAEREWMAGLK